MAWRHRFRHYVGLEREAAKLSALLGQFAFGTAREVLQSQGQPAALPTAAPRAAAHPVLTP
jgi:hypothetical protein